MKNRTLSLTSVLGLACMMAVMVSAVVPLFKVAAGLRIAPAAQPLDPTPPDHPVKLIFIHHSTGGNWLASPSDNELGGDLGRLLMENNYFVSATNYGWGPDSIGDATDIPNWVDWFNGDNSPTYLNALYNENGQNIGDFGAWPRLVGDPGGENEIILFKSCFPNSDLEGKPDDPPDPEGWLSVGHSKYVYNEILKNFATRPDKLFIVITAPPLSSGNTTQAHATNARGLNEWLINDWLRENNYTLSNVAVFDLYNVLTGPDSHHRFINGQIEHIVGSRNTLYYPSGDDHPSREGNRKAADEFIPLLNIFYHQWITSGTSSLPPATEAAPPAGEVPAPVLPSGSGTGLASSLVDDFESGAPTDTPGWEAYWGETFPTRMNCSTSNDVAHQGASALKLDFDVPPGSWATCTLSYGNQQDWTGGDGISVYLHAVQAAVPFDMLLFGGTPENQETYIYYLDTPEESVDGWGQIYVPWANFVRVDWEAGAGTPFTHPEQVWGFGFGFDGLESVSNSAVVWVDDIQLAGTAPAQEPVEQPPVEATSQPQPDGGGGGLPCVGSVLLPVLLIGVTLIMRRRS